MPKTIRKIAVSITASLLALITMVATTYAWVGMLSYSEIGGFQINLKPQLSVSDYSIEISSSGKYSTNRSENTFSDTLNEADVKKQILDNMGVDTSYLSTNTAVNQAFNRLELQSASPSIIDGKVDFSSFNKYDLNKDTFVEAKDYYKFDIYLSLNTVSGEVLPGANYITDLFLDSYLGGSITGEYVYGQSVNGVKYTQTFIDYMEERLRYEDYINDRTDDYKVISEVKPSDLIEIYNTHAARFAVQFYQGIEITEDYTEDAEPVITKIYQGGSQETFINDGGTYSFGGVLEKENNFALLEYESIYGVDLTERYNTYAARNGLSNYNTLYNIRKNDYELDANLTADYEASRKLASGSDINFGIINGKRYKVKATIYYWYEGWDADNFAIIDNTSSALNLTFCIE